MTKYCRQEEGEGCKRADNFACLYSTDQTSLAGMGVKAIVCDVNQTLFSLDAFCPKLKAAGLTQDNALEV